MWLPGFSLRKYSAKIRTYVNYLSFTDEIENNITTKKEDGIANVELLPWSYTCVYPPPPPDTQFVHVVKKSITFFETVYMCKKANN